MWAHDALRHEAILTYSKTSQSPEAMSPTPLTVLMSPAYRKTSNISRTFVGNKIVDNSDVVGASPVGAAPTTSSFST